MKKLLLLAAMLLAGAALSPALKATTIADWDFDTIGTEAAPYNTPSATIGTGSATQLGMTNSYTFASGEGPGSVASCDVLSSSGASTGSGSYGWRVRGNGNTSGSGPGVANGWNSAAPIGTQGAEFYVNTGAFNNITLTLDINATGQAERNLAIEYTLDDTAGTPTWLNATITSAGSLGTLATNSSSSNTITGNYVKLGTTGSGWNNQISATFSGVAQDPNFAFEVVNASTGADDVNGSGAALNNSSGNWRYDNVLISGQAVPEPASTAAILMGVGLLAGAGRIRRSIFKA